jgi:O-antigen/teichoic acid export membrane protein
VGRLVLAAAVLAIGARTVGLAWTLPTGAAVMATWWLVRNRVDRRPAQQAGEGTLPFVAATTVANGIAQVLLAAGPLAVAALGATAATTTVVFVTTTAARAPLVFVHSGALARILPAMQQMVADGRRSELRGQVVRWIAPGMAVLALAAVAGAAAGPPLVGLAFGAALRPGILLATLTAVSVVLAMGALLLNQVAIALDDSSHLLPPWLLGLAAGAAGLVIAGPDPVARVAVASTAGLGVATVAVLVQVLRRLGRPDAAR